MSREQSETGTGWPQISPRRPSGPGGQPDPRPDAPPPDELSPLAPENEPTVPVPPAGPEPDEEPGTPAPEGDPGEEPPPSDGDAGPGATVDLSREPADDAPATPAQEGLRGRLSSATIMIAALLALLGFTLVVQLKTNSADPTLAATRQEDLVRILSDLESQEERLRQDIAGLEDSQRQLTSGAEGRKAALEEATRRADELGILAGTLPATGPGLDVRFTAGSKPVRAATLLDAVQELRGAGAEAMQISGGNGGAVRVIASTYFLDPPRGQDGIVVDGRRLTGPYTITVIGDPATMRTALNIPGGVVASVNGDGGNVIVEERETAEVSALHGTTDLKYAHPVS